MKKIILVFLLSVSFSAFSQSDKDKTQILQTLENQRQAWNTGDIEGYMKGYWESDSLLFVGKNGPTYGYVNTLNNYKKSYPNTDAMGQLHFGIKKVEFLSKDAAFVLGSWSLKRKADEPKGYFTLIFRKIKNVWTLVSDHSS